jgi:DNA-directed RNA polymerase specialized sigma subunit
MEVVTLKVWEGLTLVEIAVRLGMSKSRAGQLWQSDIKILHTSLANWQAEV